MSSEEGKGTKKDGESTAKVTPDEPAALQELEDRLIDRLLRKVREESGSEELGELEYVDTASVGRSWVPGQGQVRYGSLTVCAGCDLYERLPTSPPPGRWDVPARPVMELSLGKESSGAYFWGLEEQ